MMVYPQNLCSDPDLKLAGLSIWALSRQFPNSEDYWDGNWINIHARVEAPGARVDVDGPWLRSDEVARFLDQLEILNRELTGAAELICMEPMLKVTVTCGPLGHIEKVVDITPDQITQSHRFAFSSDQTCLSLADQPVRFW